MNLMLGHTFCAAQILDQNRSPSVQDYSSTSCRFDRARRGVHSSPPTHCLELASLPTYLFRLTCPLPPPYNPLALKRIQILKLFRERDFLTEAAANARDGSGTIVCLVDRDG